MEYVPKPYCASQGRRRVNEGRSAAHDGRAGAFNRCVLGSATAQAPEWVESLRRVYTTPNGVIFSRADKSWLYRPVSRFDMNALSECLCVRALKRVTNKDFSFRLMHSRRAQSRYFGSSLRCFYLPNRGKSVGQLEHAIAVDLLRFFTRGEDRLPGGFVKGCIQLVPGHELAETSCLGEFGVRLGPW